LENDICVGNSLVVMYSKCGIIGDALCMFRGISEKNVRDVTKGKVFFRVHWSEKIDEASDLALCLHGGCSWPVQRGGRSESVGDEHAYGSKLNGMADFAEFVQGAF
jgi:hypothetical protein